MLQKAGVQLLLRVVWPRGYSHAVVILWRVGKRGEGGVDAKY